MILKITFNDNDYTQLLEEMIQEHTLLTILDDYSLELYEKCIIGWLKRKQLPEVTLNYLLQNLKISIVPYCTNKWENGEVVYYFIKNRNNYIVC